MDPVDRRDALKCMAWAGTGLVWTLVGGVPRAFALGTGQAAAGGLTFVQISDTHFGFNKDANPDVVATARAAVQAVNGLTPQPAFILHTGDVSHLSKPAEFDQARQVLSELKAGPIHFTPGEHDVLDDNPGSLFRAGFSPASKGDGWYSFDQGGAHFVCLVNVMSFKAGGLGQLGGEQIAWLADDLKGVSDSTPVVVFTHIPLWSLYPQWGWATGDAEQALAHLRRFGSVTVLNGHIHQVIQKVEGNVTLQTAMSTAYPQPRPGEGPGPGPLKVPAERLRSVLGVRSVEFKPDIGKPALLDRPLA